MAANITLAPRMETVRRRLLSALDRFDAEPQAANTLLLAAWGGTRLALVLGMVLGRHFCDPFFYKYAADLATGLWPYRSVQVEYPPLAMLLLLLPALPLLPFGNLAPRPDPALIGPFTQMPVPNIVRYSAYGLSFAVEMLLIDAVTLWLVRVAARRWLPRDPQGVRAGLLYIAVIFLNGALLQKFELAAGTLVLAAVLALLSGQTRWAWLALAGAALVKGFPILLAPLFVLYLVHRARGRRASFPWGALVAETRRGILWCGGALAVVTLPILLAAGPTPIVHTILYHAGRGTEIESLYATVIMALGWLPGLGVSTSFSSLDLSRIVISPLDRYSAAASYALLALFLVGAYVVCWRTWGTRRPQAAKGAAIQELASAQMLGYCVVAILLAFLLTFRALPGHYLLDVIPLAVLLRLPGKRGPSVWLGSLAAVAALGQFLTMVWVTLRALTPFGVAVLGLRNLAWLLVFGLTLAGPLQWARTLAPAPAAPPVRSSGRSLRRWLGWRWRRLIATTPPIPGFSPREEDVVAHLLSHVSARALVLGAGVCSALIYGVFVLAFPLTRLYNQPHVSNNVSLINDMGRLTGYSPLAAFGFVGAVLVLFLCQFLALLGAGRISPRPRAAPGAAPGEEDRLARRAVLFFPAAFIAIMIWMQPVTTTDLYGYVARGYLFVYQHLDPMTHPATLLPGGLRVNRPAAPYGPLWLLVAGAVARLTGPNLLVNMLAFKSIAAAATLAALALADALARRLDPERRLRVLVLFGWSPLLIFEAIGNGHNDILMMACVLAAFLCMLHGRARIALALLVVGALVKYVAAVFIPLWLVYELWRGAARSGGATGSGAAVVLAPGGEGEGTADETTGPAGLGDAVRGRARALARSLRQVDRGRATNLIASAIVIGGGLIAACYAPFWDGLKTFTGLGQQLRPLYYNSSIVAFLTAPLQVVVAPNAFGALDKTVRLVFYVLFGTYVLIQVNRLWQRGPGATLLNVITAAAKITLAALILITFWYQPWYVVWLLPLAALSETSYVRRAATILAAGSLLTYAVSSFLFAGEAGLAQSLFVQFFEILVAFGPLLLLRAAPYEGGLLSIGRRYLGSFGLGLREHPVLWERITLGLVLFVAALLRLLRLGNLFAPIPGREASQELAQISSDLGLYLSDPQGLSAPFTALRAVVVGVFGPTPFAVLLPSAVIGTLTVLVIYLLARELLRQGGWAGAEGVALLAALLAATSLWHVSLSRSGMEVVLLPLLMCTALYWLLLAFRLGAPAANEPTARPPVPAGAEAPAQADAASARAQHRACMLLYAGCGLCTGVACDLAPGLWLLPLLVIGFLLAWRWQRAASSAGLRARIAVLLGSAVLSGLPAVGYLVGRQIGFPAGSPVFARTPGKPAPAPSLFSLEVWGHIAQNIVSVVHLLIAQDYTAGYPADGSTPIIPVLLGPVFVLGLVIAIVRWRNLTAVGVLLLVALPLAASVAVASSPDVIEAACVLPATCIVPALALYEIGRFLGHLPIVLDRINGSRIFTTPAQIGRVLLLIFLIVSAIRTFFWYFEATLPSAPPNQDIPSYVAPPPPSRVLTSAAPSTGRDFGWSELPNAAAAGIVLVRVVERPPA